MINHFARNILPPVPTRPIRVLHLTTAFPRGPNDPIVPWLVELLKRLRERGVESEVLTSAYKGSPDQTHEGIRVHRFRYFAARWENLTHEEAAPDRMRRSPLYRFLPLFFVVAGMRAARRVARDGGYDVIHVHWPLPLALLGWAAARAARAPIVTLFYGVELRLVDRSFRVLRGFLRWAVRRSDRVVAISSYTAAEVEKLAPGTAVSVIPYTFELPARGVTSSRAAPGFTVLFVGRLVERKGVVHLVDALARIPRELQVRLEIVGGGPDSAAIAARAAERGVSDRIALRGRLPDAELHAAYATADAFVLPAVADSRGDTEGLGVVLLEAMHFGVPVIGSAVGGILDIVVDGESGLLVPPGDPSALAGAITRLASDRELARRLGAAGRTRLATHFAWPTIVEQWRALYAGLLAGAARPAGR